jgi:tetratricopeptide (TPR) repeat protein
MKQPLGPSTIRIRTSDDKVIGAGFLVGERYVLTCAHVVPADIQEAPADEVLLDFPLIEPERTLTAHVIHWDAERDVAGLELTKAPPADAQPVRLVTTDDLWGHSFRAFGIPAGYDDGVWTSGVLRGRIGSGWVQIEDVKEPGYWVQPGFSGTPIWDEQLDGVVGMVVAADTDRATKAAFMIPAQALVEVWPELAEHSLEAGSLEHLQMQLARLEEAQRQAADPGRFQPQIDALKERIDTWSGRVERQRQRITEGLEDQRQRMAEERARRREEERLQVVGQPPLDVADYFKDRQRDLQKLGQLLSEPTTRLVSVIGHGGMGKTALACKVLQDLERHRWPYAEEEVPIDGIVYLSTRTAGISLERLFLDCAKLLGGEEQERLNAVWTNPQLETEEKIARLLETLRDGHCVILLDNLEDLLDEQGRLTDDDLRLFFERALMSSQGAQLMVTSRVALTFRREVMRFDRQVKLLEGLPTEDGVALLRELDPNGDYGLRDAPKEQLAQAVELTHGVPRALEVLAGILANDPFATLDEVLETFYEQEDVVQALIEENYQRLDRDARRVIEALAVFKKPVPPLAVDYLLEPFAPGLDVPNVVQRLTRTNIVNVDRAAKTVTLHPIDQDYAYSQLPEEDETEAKYTRQALERRAADYYVQLRTPEETWESIDDLEPQLNEFEHRVRAGGLNKSCKMLDQFEPYLFLWGHYNKLIDLRKKMLGQLDDPSLQIVTLSHLGRAYRCIAKYEESIEVCRKALKLARRIGDLQQEGIAFGGLGSTYYSLLECEQAIKCHRRSLNIAQQIGNRRMEAIRLGQIGHICRIEGRLGQAVKLDKKALTISREEGYRNLEGYKLGNLGRDYNTMGEHKKAFELFKQALLIAQQRGERRGESIWLGHLGNTCYALGQIERAVEYHKKALKIDLEIKDQGRRSRHLLELGKDLLTNKQISEARKCFLETASLKVVKYSYQAVLMLGIVSLYQSVCFCQLKTTVSGGKNIFTDAVNRCQSVLEKSARLYRPQYILATALVGQAVCDPRWEDESQRPDLLAPALEEYRRALDITAAPGIVQDAIRDLELIQAAGIEGLKPAFELLENAEYEPDLPEDLGQSHLY